MSKTTKIITTADLFSHKERIEHISKLGPFLKESIIEFICSAGIHYYEFVNEKWKILIYIKFRGIDDWHRAVFKDVNSNTYYGDYNSRKTGKPKDVIAYYKKNIMELDYFGRSFNCEPNGGMNPDIQLQIID